MLGCAPPAQGPLGIRTFGHFGHLGHLNNRVKRQDDLAGAASGHGHYCPDGVELEAAVCAILAAIAIAFALLYSTVTAITGGRRKRRADTPPQDIWDEISIRIADVIWWGNIYFLCTLGCVKNYNPYHNTFSSIV